MTDVIVIAKDSKIYIYIKTNADIGERGKAVTGRAREQISARKGGPRKAASMKFWFICPDLRVNSENTGGINLGSVIPSLPGQRFPSF